MKYEEVEVREFPQFLLFSFQLLVMGLACSKTCVPFLTHANSVTSANQQVLLHKYQLSYHEVNDIFFCLSMISFCHIRFIY